MRYNWQYISQSLENSGLPSVSPPYNEENYEENSNNDGGVDHYDDGHCPGRYGACGNWDNRWRRGGHIFVAHHTQNVDTTGPQQSYLRWG